MRHLAASVAAVLLLVTAAPAQVPRLIPGVSAGELTGIDVADAGDVDGDGVSDVIVGSSWGAPDVVIPPATNQLGRATVYSGATGAVLHVFTAAFPDTFFGWSVGGAGDVDGDGHADLIVGEPWGDHSGFTDPGKAYVYSGLTGALLYTKLGVDTHDWFGYSVSGAGDVDNDGRDDFMVAAPAETDLSAFPPGPFPPLAHGAVRVYSGIDGSEIHWLAANLIQNGFANGFGTSIAAVGDVDGDGHDDVIVGAPKMPIYNDANYAGYAIVFSGQTGLPLHTFIGPNPASRLGYVGAAGDVDGDGTPDVIVGCRARVAGVSCAHVFSGATGAQLHVFSGPPVQDEFGFTVTGVGDVDGDGRDDLMVGAAQLTQGDPGYVRVYSGQTGQQIWGMSGLHDGDRFGFTLTHADDVDGDGVPEAVIGSPYEAGHKGVVRLVSLRYGLEIKKPSSASVTTTFWADRPGERLMLAVDAPLPAPGFLSTPFGDLYTSIGNPGPNLLLLDGLGATGAPRPDMVTGPDSRWTRSFPVNPAVLAGATFVVQVYAYDEQRPWPEKLIVSNPAGLEF